MNRAIVHLLAISFCLLIAIGGFAAAPAASAAAPATLAAHIDQTANELATYLDRLAAIGFRGAVLIERNGTELLAAGYGPLVPGGAETIGPHTVFAIGSNTKPFTAAAILKLQDQGKLAVDDSISRYFPEVPADKATITLDQLLTHSAGFDHSGIFGGDFEEVARDDAVRRILASDLLFRPGSESSYADADMILLAAVVEIASGQTYEDFLRAELFAPAGMTQTGFRGPAAPHQARDAAGIVAGTPVGGPAQLPPLTWSLKGAGGMVSSVSDLYRWHRAVASGAILSPEARDAFAAPHVSLGPAVSEGYGWVVAEPRSGHHVRGSAGGTPELGHQNVIRWWTDDDLLIIVSSADASYHAEDVVPTIENILFGRPQPLPPVIAAIDPDRLDTFAGRYVLPEGGAIDVAAAHDRLIVRPVGAAGFAALFPPPIAGPSPEQSDPAATIAFLERGGEGGLESWIATQETTLGPFQEFTVVGTASPEGGGEGWTYVAFEFARGSVLSRWIVRPGGVLDAAVLPSEPPRVTFLPVADDAFVSFALGQTASTAATFAENDDGRLVFSLTTPDGRTVGAVQSG